MTDTERINELEKQLREMRRALYEIPQFPKGRMQIPNLEGNFNVLTAVPTDTNFKDGTIVFSLVGGVYSIHAFIKGAWVSATLT